MNIFYSPAVSPVLLYGIICAVAPVGPVNIFAYGSLARIGFNGVSYINRGGLNR
jgi:hypothetical protein